MSLQLERHEHRVNAASCVGPLLLTIFFAAFANQAAAQIRPTDLGTLHDRSCVAFCAR